MEIRRKWDLRRVAAAMFGALLWLQLATGPLSREIGDVEPDPWRIGVYLLPLALLVSLTLWRSRLVALLLFPTSFGGVLLVAPPSSAAASPSPTHVILAALTLVSYVATAGAWLQLPAEKQVLEASREPLRRSADRWRPYHGTTLPRAILLLAAFFVTAGAVVLIPDLSLRVARSFAAPGDRSAADLGLVLCCLLLFFVWCVLAFVLFAAPALELESRARHTETQMQATLARSFTRGRRVAFFVWVGLALVMMAALVLVRYA